MQGLQVRQVRCFETSLRIVSRSDELVSGVFRGRLFRCAACVREEPGNVSKWPPPSYEIELERAVGCLVLAQTELSASNAQALIDFVDYCTGGDMKLASKV